jgi:rhodanese-related sulfurtransferase
MIEDMDMPSARDIKDKLNEQFAKIGHALSSPKRLELLELLHQCEKSVETLVENTGMSVANTSQHLQVLRGAGLVETRREGIYVFYRLADQQVSDLVSNMKRVAQSRLAEVERVISDLTQDLGEVESMDRGQLLKLAKAGKIVVLDVRPEDEYLAEHIPHALSIPLVQLKSHLNKLPQNQKIVAYCRGPYCVLSGQAVRVLRSRGFNASLLGDGMDEWKAAGMPVVRANQ